MVKEIKDIKTSRLIVTFGQDFSEFLSLKRITEEYKKDQRNPTGKPSLYRKSVYGIKNLELPKDVLIPNELKHEKYYQTYTYYKEPGSEKAYGQTLSDVFPKEILEKIVGDIFENHKNSNVKLTVNGETKEISGQEVLKKWKSVIEQKEINKKEEKIERKAQKKLKKKANTEITPTEDPLVLKVKKKPRSQGH